MKTRVISGLVGVLLLVAVFALLDTFVLNLVVGGISLMGVYEMLNATGCTKSRALTALSYLMALVIPFARVRPVRPYLMQVIFLLILSFFILLIRCHEQLRIEQCAMAIVFSTVVPLFFSCAVYLRDDHELLVGGFYLLMAFGAAWLCDTGAYFVGSAFGRHKMAPRISPKKTWEGAVGGVAVCTLCMLLLAWAYGGVLARLGIGVEIRYGLVALTMPVFAVAGMLGDLFASVIKREFGIKDYGNIMPGHGGILDRFDSVLFTLPTVYVAVQHLTIVRMV